MIDGRALRTKRHADANFARSLADRAGDNAVESNGSQEQGQRGKASDEPGGGAVMAALSAGTIDGPACEVRTIRMK